ncbi:hypothetical protein SAMN05216285_3198 [Natrinema salifodinae]|uniref:DUF7344 domain-containing protein n=1 Tax=Natrinema salifodinae TaxID=1202768 RepID=A0A1I0Q7K1_9EURY|nr:hypothetical protein SAMN05216285_3198 [Natrinema salifodinae]
MTGHSPKAGVAERGDPDEQSFDVVFDLLANQRRRYVLRCLQKFEDRIALTDVADEIARWENETNHMDISEEEVERVATSLYHVHIPKLADADVVEYDQEQNVVALSKNAEQLEPFLVSVTE